MLTQLVDAEFDWRSLVTVRLLRRWVSAEAAEESPLPSLVHLAAELGVSAEGAVALASVFQLTQSCLGRPLRAECCCSRTFGSDELAVLSMLARTPDLDVPQTSSDMPHGLPSALRWALHAARRSWGETQVHPSRAAPTRCPFNAS